MSDDSNRGDVIMDLSSLVSGSGGSLMTSHISEEGNNAHGSHVFLCTRMVVV